MLVKDCMTRHPVLGSPKMLASEAERLMAENKIRHLPVVGDGKRLLGLVTPQRMMLKTDAMGSLNVWEIGRLIANLTLDQIMLKEKNVYTISPNASIEWAASFLSEYKIGCLPVVDDDGVVVGIVTETDILRSFQEMLGLPAPGLRATIRMPNQPGEFARLTNVIAENNWGVMGFGTYPSPRRPGFYEAVIKLRGVTIKDAEAVLGSIPNQELLDIREWSYGGDEDAERF